jgi:hypothetical protein
VINRSGPPSKSHPAGPSWDRRPPVAPGSRADSIVSGGRSLSDGQKILAGIHARRAMRDPGDLTVRLPITRGS